MQAGAQTQKSFPGPAMPGRDEGYSTRRSWDGSFQPHLGAPSKARPEWVPGGARSGAPGSDFRPDQPPERMPSHGPRLQPSHHRAPVAYPGPSEAWARLGSDAAEHDDHVVMSSFSSSGAPAPAPAPAVRAAINVEPPPAMEARGHRPREEEDELEHLDEEFYQRLSKLRAEHQRNIDEISRLYDSSDLMRHRARARARARAPHRRPPRTRCPR